MLQSAFIVLTISLAILLCVGVSRVAGKISSSGSKAKKITVVTCIAVTAWLAYVGGISMTGIFAATSLPPRLPLLLVLPTFAGMAVFFISKKSRTFIASTPLRWLVATQSFRIIVELLILQMYTAGMFPKAVTFEGYNMDILIGLTAPVTAYFAGSSGRYSKWLLVTWNIAGLATLAIVVSVLLSYAYFPHIWGLPVGIAAKGGFQAPYTFLAGFLMPVAVFLHIFSLVKLKRGL